MRRIAAIIRKKLDEAVDSAQTNIPAQNLINQFSGRNVPPGGPSGSGYPPAPHEHDAADIVSGVLDTARLGSGTADSTTFLRGDSTWQVISGGGTVTSVGLTVPAEFSVTNSPITTSGDIALAWAAPVSLAHGGSGADLSATGGAHQIVRQNSAGGAFTVSVLAADDIPDLSATYQPLDSDLTAIAALGSTGLAARTAANTWAQRTITGTSNRLSVSNGNGVSGDPTLDISASYAGQASITTLGTITTGTWSGSNLSESQITGLVSDLSALSAGIAASQPLDGDLTALAALSSTGLAARTAANTWAQRTITGTSNRITVTNGDGVSGNPTVDISTSYTGQTTIATLGTVTSGVWAAVSIGVNHGGTGFGVYAVGDILYASGTTAFAKLNAVATGNVLISGGVATAPSWDKVDLTAHVTGLLPPANGGTGAANTGNLAWASGGGTAALISTGTYTPTYLGQATPGTTTYTTQQGAWVKIGNVITVTGTIVWTAASGTGNANISLPFAAASVTDQAFSGSCRVANVTFANGTPVILLSSGASAFILNSPATNAGSTTVAVEAAGSVTFTITYFF